MAASHLTGFLSALALLPAMAADAQTGRPPGVPRIEGLAYPEARLRLRRSGWRPLIHPTAASGNSDLRTGNGPFVSERGWREAVSCAGTGLAPCLFRFRGPRGRVIEVVTLGEAPDLVVDRVAARRRQ